MPHIYVTLIFLYKSNNKQLTNHSCMLYITKLKESFFYPDKRLEMNTSLKILRDVRIGKKKRTVAKS